MAKFKPMELIGEIHGKFSGESEYYAAEKSKKWFPTNKWLFGNPEQPLFCILGGIIPPVLGIDKWRNSCFFA